MFSSSSRRVPPRGLLGVGPLAALAVALAGCAAEVHAEGDALAEDEADVAAIGLGCVRRPRTILDVTPARIGPIVPGSVARYAVRVKNNDARLCGASEFTVATELNAIEQGLTWDDWTSASIAPGGVATLSVSVHGDATLEPGTYGLPFRVVRLGDQTDLPGAAGRAELVVGGPPGACEVRSRSELLVRDLTVVEDPRRTVLGKASDSAQGAWTFTRLIENVARTPADAPALVDALFRSFAGNQTINGFEVYARRDAEQFLLTPWSKSADGRLDLARVPLRLLAIVNRMDLRNLDEGHAGELAFVFGMFNPLDFTQGAPTRRAREVDFTLVLEYRVPARTTDDVIAWARAWHQLGSLPFPSESYNAALEALTRRVTARGALPGAINDSALLRVRTNDGKLEGSGDWQLREFALAPETGALVPRPTRRTPDNDFIQSEPLARFVNANARAILHETHEVPEMFEGLPFQAGASQNDNGAWDAEGITDPELRHRFAVNTCNGCHGLETETDRKHISSRLEGELSFLSPYLLGETVSDPVSGAPRSFGELARRRADLEDILCGTDASGAATRKPTVSGAPPASPTGPAPSDPPPSDPPPTDAPADDASTPQPPAADATDAGVPADPVPPSADSSPAAPASADSSGMFLRTDRAARLSYGISRTH